MSSDVFHSITNGHLDAKRLRNPLTHYLHGAVPENIFNSGVNKKPPKELSFLETVTGSTTTVSDSLKCSRGPSSPVRCLTGLQTGDAVTSPPHAGSFGLCQY